MAGRSRNNVSAVIYDDFQPHSERKEEPTANVLLVHLPGFGKDQISVTYVDSSRTIKVQGERPLLKNRRSRFNQAFPVPQNSVIEKIQGTFRNGILTITIPKQIVDQVSPAKDTSADKETTPKATIDQTPVENKKETISPPKATPKATIDQTPVESKKETISPPKADSPKPVASSSNADARQSNGKKVETLQPRKQTDAKASGSKAEVAEQKDHVEEKEAEHVVKDPTLLVPTYIPKTLEKGKEDDHKAKLVSEPNIRKRSGKEKEDDHKRGVVEDSKAVKGGSFMEKAKEIKGMETIMKTMKRLATDDPEERQLLINVGISVVVIVALGAYITYSYRSGKAKN